MVLDTHKTKATHMQNEYTQAIAERVRYELEDKNNQKLSPDFAKLTKACEHETIAQIMRAHNVDANYINRQERSNARYNIKSAIKVPNIARVIAAVDRLNHYTRAVLLTARALEANGLMLTHNDAQAACSKQIKARDNKRDKLIVRYDANIAPSTVTTQSSSSINALQMFNVLIETRDAANVVSYKLAENETTRKLLDYCDATQA